MPTFPTSVECCPPPNAPSRSLQAPQKPPSKPRFEPSLKFLRNEVPLQTAGGKAASKVGSPLAKPLFVHLHLDAYLGNECMSRPSSPSVFHHTSCHLKDQLITCYKTSWCNRKILRRTRGSNPGCGGRHQIRANRACCIGLLKTQKIDR